MRWLNTKKFSKYEYALMCMVILISLVFWGFWEMTFSVLGVVYDMIKSLF
ncbi:hypothetical protein VP496E541_P0114 [Vibrio phage 496E54-1]|nr:hypothetical protein VP495E541_P0115 [Vibrio phage 495E54-1]CAH9013670.1 hypothetical protein VP496E541_P0114 [Vibrio phage 496E54-1]